MGVPAQMVSMPLAGGAAPVTLIGSVVQHAAECLSGIAIHQLASPGSPIVWGGAPAILDMRSGTTPMGAVETAMIDAAYAQVGKSLGLPTHTYLVGSDAKLVDAQAGMESATGAVIAALAGVDLVSGAGMLDTLLCQSAEKLVVDAEAISSALRLVTRHRDADGDPRHGVVRRGRPRGPLPRAARDAEAVPRRSSTSRRPSSSDGRTAPGRTRARSTPSRTRAIGPTLSWPRGSRLRSTRRSPPASSRSRDGRPRRSA